jgi:hypothetical protein
MGRKASIDQATGKALLDAYQRHGTIAAAAREVGVSESAARRYVETIPKAAAPVLAQQQQLLAAETSLWKTRGALDYNYQRLIKLMDMLEKGILEEREGPQGPYTTQTPITTHIAALREIREHIQAAMKLYELFVSVDETRRFRDAVLEAIGEADDATRARIVQKLHARRTLDLAL